MQNTNMILIFIFVALLGVFGFMIYEANQDSPTENIAESFSEATEEIGDEIDDSTTN